MLFKSYIYNKKKSFLKIKMRKTIYHKKALDCFIGITKGILFYFLLFVFVPVRVVVLC